MQIRAFILGVFLLALVGWCLVHETMRQTRARYALAEAFRKEEEVVRRLEILQVQEESLLQPARLLSQARLLNLETASLLATPRQLGTNSPGRLRLPADNHLDLPVALAGER